MTTVFPNREREKAMMNRRERRRFAAVNWRAQSSPFAIFSEMLDILTAGAFNNEEVERTEK